MHTVWKGAISFGLVHIPVKMFTATENKDISFRYIHEACGTPISYVKMCKTCEIEVDFADIARGFEYENGKFVLFTKEELEQLGGESSKEIKIVDFVDLHEIDPIYFQKTYYLSPADTGANAYSLLKEAMQQTGKIAIANVTIRTKNTLAALRIIGPCLALETIFYPDEIRPAAQIPNLPLNTEVNEQELEMAQMLIKQLSAPFTPEKYSDQNRQRILEQIEQKIAGEEIAQAPQRPATNVIDLMSALQASLESIQKDENTKQEESKVGSP